MSVNQLNQLAELYKTYPKGFEREAKQLIENASQLNKANILTKLRKITFPNIPDYLMSSDDEKKAMRQYQEQLIINKIESPIIINDKKAFFDYFATHQHPIIKLLFLSGRRTAEILTDEIMKYDDRFTITTSIKQRGKPKTISFPGLAPNIDELSKQVIKTYGQLNHNSITQTLNRHIKKDALILTQNKIITIAQSKFTIHTLRSAYSLYAFKSFGNGYTQAKFVHDILGHKDYNVGRTYVNTIIFANDGQNEPMKYKPAIKQESTKTKDLSTFRCYLLMPIKILKIFDSENVIVKRNELPVGELIGPFEDQREIIIHVIKENPQNMQYSVNKLKNVLSNSVGHYRMKKTNKIRHYSLRGSKQIDASNKYKNSFILKVEPKL